MKSTIFSIMLRNTLLFAAVLLSATSVFAQKADISGTKLSAAELRQPDAADSKTPASVSDLKKY